jgi:DNA-binding IclR family transcriptional regulator
MLSYEEIVTIVKMKRLEKFTPFTITSPKELMKRIEQIKKDGYAVSVQERYLYTAGIAAPCFVGTNVIGSIGAIGPAERIRATSIQKTGKTVKKIAERLSEELGYSQKPARLPEIGKGLRTVK